MLLLSFRPGTNVKARGFARPGSSASSPTSTANGASSCHSRSPAATVAVSPCNAHWPTDKSLAQAGAAETETALLERLQRRPHALNKRERDQLTKLLKRQR